jgi:diketogulonate reductase-like aldo/keto reductase
MANNLSSLPPVATVDTDLLAKSHFGKSLNSNRPDHPGTDVIDSYVLHGPSRSVGLGAADGEAWRVVEEIHASGRARLLGVSNVSAGQLEDLCDSARVPPRFVQNRCHAAHGWDRDVQAVCAAKGITYQGFSLLTANRHMLAHPDVQRIAARHRRTPAQIVFRFALGVGVVPLTGTTNADHVRQGLDAFDFRLAPQEVEQFEGIG